MSRELTREEKAAIRSLVVKWCANYDRECGCLPLDCECYMLGKCWTGAYCRYFREAVLPLDPALEAALLTEGPRPDIKVCPVCAVNMTECAGVEPEPVETEETGEPAPEEAEPETGGNMGMLLLVLAVAVIGGGAGWYFKIYRPKHEKAAEPEEDYGGELDGYDGGEPYGDEDDDGPPWDEEDEDGEEADK